MDALPTGRVRRKFQQAVQLIRFTAYGLDCTADGNGCKSSPSGQEKLQVDILECNAELLTRSMVTYMA